MRRTDIPQEVKGLDRPGPLPGKKVRKGPGSGTFQENRKRGDIPLSEQKKEELLDELEKDQVFDLDFMISLGLLGTPGNNIERTMNYLDWLLCRHALQGRLPAYRRKLERIRSQIQEEQWTTQA